MEKLIVYDLFKKKILLHLQPRKKREIIIIIYF